MPRIGGRRRRFFALTQCFTRGVFFNNGFFARMHFGRLTSGVQQPFGLAGSAREVYNRLGNPRFEVHAGSGLQ